MTESTSPTADDATAAISPQDMEMNLDENTSNALAETINVDSLDPAYSAQARESLSPGLGLVPQQHSVNGLDSHPSPPQSLLPFSPQDITMTTKQQSPDMDNNSIQYINSSTIDDENQSNGINMDNYATITDFLPTSIPERNEEDQQRLLQQQQEPSNLNSGSTTQTNTPTLPSNTTIITDENNSNSSNNNDDVNTSFSLLSSSSPFYPPANKPLDQLSMDERMARVGRSCPCEEIEPTGMTCSCQGWKPKAGTPDLTDTSCILCLCGHRLSSHGGPWFGEEFDRRLKAATRRDELLQDKGKLFDFDYTDEDVISLRKQIVPRPQHFSNDTTTTTTTTATTKIPLSLSSSSSSPSSSTSRLESDNSEKRSRQSSMALDTDVTVKEEHIDHTEEQQRNSKRIRLEANGLSHGHDEGEEEEEEDEVEEIANGKVIAKESQTNGEEEPREQSPNQNTTEVLDEEDEVPVKKEKPAVVEEREGLIEFRVISNDGSRESMILLTGMKNIFQKQLPKMPREYIARLVYDRNHYSMAIVKAPLIVLGGITYRPFNHRKFAEIVFCAITSSEQVKGYGSHLMNHLKDYISEYTQVRHFLTYADNYAIGYFKKQGFTKDITLDRSIWMGYIKDYEGGTIMQCTTVPRVKYLDVNNLLSVQRKAVVTKIKEVTKSHIIYPGLQDFKNGKTEVDPMSVPGIQESGWDPLMDTTPRVPKHGQYYNAMKHIVSELTKDASSWPFLTPVDVEAVTDYYSYIKDPMDLATLESNVDADVYKTLDEFAVDCKKIFDNCRIYNGEGTPYVKCANKLEKVFKDKLKEWKET